MAPRLRTYSKRISTSEMETSDEKKAKEERENQQLFIYLFISVMLVLAWLLGTYGVSFFWIFGIIAMTFAVWRNKAMTLLDRHLRQKELILHRRRALRQSETTEWFNFLINRWWVFSSSGISDLLQRHLDPLLQDIKPPYLESIEMKSFNLGDKTPFVKYVHVHEHADGGKRPMAWTNVTTPPSGLDRLQTYQLVLEADVGLLCEDFKMIFLARLGGKRLGMNMDLALERLTITGKLQLIIHLDKDTPFPHVSAVTASFIDKPEVLFAVRVLSMIQIMEIPLLKAWLQRVVEDGFTHALVDPGKVDFKLETYGPTNIPDKVKPKRKAEGVLTVCISGENVKGSVFVDDMRYCQLRVGDQKQHTTHRHAPSQFEDSASFLVYDLKKDKLTIKSKTKILLSTQTLAQFDVALTDQPLTQKESVDIQLESKISKTKLSGATIKLNVTLKYTALPSIDDLIHQATAQAKPSKKVSKKRSSLQPSPAIDLTTNCGVLYVCVHNAIGLLGLDRNGFSDPYCIIYNNGKKLKTTHYVSKTKNPKWDVSTELIIDDVSKCMLSFILYDWDGTSMSEDDFLGSAHLLMRKDEPVIVRRSLTLGYNLLNMGQVENNKLGSVCVSAAFRPVPGVSNREIDGFDLKPLEHHAGNKGFLSSAENNSEEKDSRKLLKRNAVKKLLSTGQGILEVNLQQAKDLISADSNGLSDPYCEVLVNSERKFVTSVKKKTLNPIWDEWLTLPLPKQSDTLELIVWDKDAFFQKDFLGAVTFTLEDLKRYGESSQHTGWFELQRTRSGWIQVHFKIISDEIVEKDLEDMKEVIDENRSPGSAFSQGDSGIFSEAVAVQDKKILSSYDLKEQESQQTSTLPRTRPSKNEKLDPTSSSEGSEKKDIITRSASEVDVKVEGRRDLDNVYSTLSRPYSLSVSNQMFENGSNLRRSSSSSSLQVNEKFYWVQGRLGRIQGLSNDISHIYCKIRLDNRRNVQRRKKFSQGQVISKTGSIIGSHDADFSHPFDVDQGFGVAKEALLIFDLKTTNKEHLATKGYVVSDILQGEDEVSRWLALEHGVQLEVMLSHSDKKPLVKNKSKNMGFFSSFRKSKIKI